MLAPGVGHLLADRDRRTSAPADLSRRLSSHLLHKVKVIADDLVVIGNGRIVAQGTRADLLTPAGTDGRAGDASTVARAMEHAKLTATSHADGSLHTDAAPDRVGDIALVVAVR